MSDLIDYPISPIPVLQSIPEVLQSLVDDGLVEKDKVGTSVYFWSFPSNALQKVLSVKVWFSCLHLCCCCCFC